jgi:hypothetical protein
MPTTTAVDGWFDVTAYTGSGAVQINNALHALTTANTLGGVLYFPPGTYTVATTINALPNGVTVRGCGSETSIIESTALTSDILSSTGKGIAIRDIGLQYSGTATNGAAIALSGATDVRVADTSISGAYIGIAIQNGTTDVYCKRVRIQSLSNNYAGVVVSGGESGVNSNLHFTDCVLQGPSAGGYGYWLENASRVFMANCNTIGFARTLLIYPYFAASSAAYDIWSINCLWDGNNISDAAACWIGPATKYTSVKNVSFTNCSFANSYYAVTAKGAVNYLCTGILFTDCTVRGSQLDGVDIIGSDHVQLVGCSIYGNGRHEANSYTGVTISAAQDVVIANCLINGAGEGYGSVNQGYAVSILDSVNVTVTACNVSGNGLTPAISLDATSGETSVIQSNSGYNPIGSVGSSHPAVPSSSPGYIQNNLGTAATIYLNGDSVNVWISDTDTFDAANKIIVPPTSGDPIRLGPTQYLQITYETKPSWQWFLD